MHLEVEYIFFFFSSYHTDRLDTVYAGTHSVLALVPDSCFRMGEVPACARLLTASCATSSRPNREKTRTDPQMIRAHHHCHWPNPTQPQQ